MSVLTLFDANSFIPRAQVVLNLMIGHVDNTEAGTGTGDSYANRSDNLSAVVAALPIGAFVITYDTFDGSPLTLTTDLTFIDTAGVVTNSVTGDQYANTPDATIHIKTADGEITEQFRTSFIYDSVLDPATPGQPTAAEVTALLTQLQWPADTYRYNGTDTNGTATSMFNWNGTTATTVTLPSTGGGGRRNRRTILRYG